MAEPQVNARVLKGEVLDKVDLVGLILVVVDGRKVICIIATQPNPPHQVQSVGRHTALLRCAVEAPDGTRSETLNVDNLCQKILETWPKY